MARPEDSALIKRVRGQIARRSIDASMLHISIFGGNIHLTGVLRKLRTHPQVDLKEEMNHLTHTLRMQPGVRDVVWEVTERS